MGGIPENKIPRRSSHLTSAGSANRTRRENQKKKTHHELQHETHTRAAAIAGLLTGASAFASGNTVAHSGVKISTLADKGTHSCKGQNACKGQGGCKSDSNSCKGQNSCKGKGGCATDGSKK